MGAFRVAARDLETMLGSVLAAAAAQAASLSHRLTVIEGFSRIATRDGLRCGLDTGQWWQMGGWCECAPVELLILARLS